MKKLLYILLFAIGSSITITACTEEEVAPLNETQNNGGGVTDPK